MIQKNVITWTKIWPSFEPNWTIPQPIHISIQIQFYLSKSQILKFDRACIITIALAWLKRMHQIYCVLAWFWLNLDISYNPRRTGIVLLMWDVGIWTWVPFSPYQCTKPELQEDPNEKIRTIVTIHVGSLGSLERSYTIRKNVTRRTQIWFEVKSKLYAFLANDPFNFRFICNGHA